MIWTYQWVHIHEKQNVQIPPRHVQILIYFLIYHPVVLNMMLGLWIRINCLPSLAWMIMIPMFEARHGRGALDSVAVSGERGSVTSSVATTHFNHKHGCD